ncbi:DNA glycosylase [Backusella circina FSU 941]|nr:DNA glycosylase [Backusella circina FSU 941]
MNSQVLECVQSKQLCHSNEYHKVSEKEKILLQNELLSWYDINKRTNMPWRKDVDQGWDRQTLGQRAYEVATVIDYYNRWMEAFPTITILANADIEEVNTIWAGLGYYSRAKRLWEGAQKVVRELDGLLPDNAKELREKIPGVGPYTAGAVASIVYSQATPVVDGNVIRVLSRWRAVNGDAKKKQVIDLFWEIAGNLVSESRPGDYNQALMELGARVCTPQNPDCSQCPIKTNCRALNQLETFQSLANEGFFKNGINKRKNGESGHECSTCPEIQSKLTEAESYAVTRYPLKVEKKPPKDEECAVSIIECQSDNELFYLISKRPDTGLLAGLWEFPSLELDDLETKYEERMIKSTEYLRSRYKIELEKEARHDLGNVVHLFSHIRKVYHIEYIQLGDAFPMKEDRNDEKWVGLDELKKAPIPTGLKKAFKLIEKFREPKKTTTKTTVKTTVKSANISNFFKVKS